MGIIMLTTQKKWNLHVQFSYLQSVVAVKNKQIPKQHTRTLSLSGASEHIFKILEILV